MPGIAGIVGGGSSGEAQAGLKQMLSALSGAGAGTTGTIVFPQADLVAGWVAHRGSYAERANSVVGPRGIQLLMAGEFLAGNPVHESYEKDQDACFARLNGLFSGLILDPDRGTACLFNDRYGIERLYWHESGDRLYFASEAKSLLAVLPGLRGWNEASVSEWLARGSVRGPATIFRGVQHLPGASIWKFGRERSRGVYFRAAEWEEIEPSSDHEYVEEFVETLRVVVPRYLSGPGRVGISITGGLDTRMIMAALRPVEPVPVCYTYQGITGDTEDGRIGRRVAAAAGLEHRDLRIQPRFLVDFGAWLDETVRATDGTAGAVTAHEVYLSEMARELAPIRLTGNYGSEILRGITTYRPLRLERRFLGPGILESVEAAAAHASGSHPVTRSAFEEVPWHLFGALAAARARLGIRSPFLDNAVVRLAYRSSARLRDSADPALALIARGPLGIAAVPTDRGLIATNPGLASRLRKFVADVQFKLDYMEKEGLPDVLAPLAPALSMLSRHGFIAQHKFLPYRSWFGREFAGLLRRDLANSDSSIWQFIDPEGAALMVDEHIAGRANRLGELNALLTLASIERVFLGARTGDVG